MKLKLSEDVREWQKAVWWGSLGMSLLATVLYWRRLLPGKGMAAAFAILALLCVSAAFRPRWFRGYYRVSRRIGFNIGQALGFLMLTAAFVLVLLPLSFLLRMFGKDLLALKRKRAPTTYWRPSRELTPLDRLY